MLRTHIAKPAFTSIPDKLLAIADEVIE
jgi:hypothetical protein